MNRWGFSFSDALMIIDIVVIEIRRAVKIDARIASCGRADTDSPWSIYEYIDPPIVAGMLIRNESFSAAVG